MNKERLKELLDGLHDKYNTIDFVENDPILIPHSFSKREDIEISAFLASTIAWGNRKAIVKSARRMIEYMDNAPFEFVSGASQTELTALDTYVHRTFNGQDFKGFIMALREFYKDGRTLGSFFEEEYAKSSDMKIVLSEFRKKFFEQEHLYRTEKHVSSIDKGAACKRLNMFLRWMVRADNAGVDFGLWTKIPMSALYLPLDVHAGNMGRALGILERKQNDWKAVEEITQNLKNLDANDPVKYDFALFGAGIDGFLK